MWVCVGVGVDVGVCDVLCVDVCVMCCVWMCVCDMCDVLCVDVCVCDMCVVCCGWMWVGKCWRGGEGRGGRKWAERKNSSQPCGPSQTCPSAHGHASAQKLETDFPP